MPDSGFHIQPGDLHQSGNTLQSFGDQVAQGGDKLQTLGDHLVSHAGRDKSGVGSIIAKALGRGTEVAGKVFSEGGRVAGAAGKRLHSNAGAHEANESGVTKSFHDITDPKGKGKSPHADGGSTPKAGKSNGSGPGYHEPKDKPKPGGENADPHRNNKSPDANTYCGDPIDVATGRMILTQTDVELAGMLRLVVSRTHVSGYRLGRRFGPSWASTVDQRLSVEDDGVHLVVADGRILSYPFPTTEAPVLPVTGARWPLWRTEDGGYLVTDPDAERGYYFAGADLPLRVIADGDGNRIELGYDPTGTLTELRHSGGYLVTVRTMDGRITALELAGRPLLEYRYDDDRLVEVVNSGGAMRFEYDTAGRITRWVDRNGIWYRYEFDGAGRCVRATGTGGMLDVTLDYDDLVTTVTDSLGHTTRYQRDDRYRVTAATDPLGHTTTYEWDEHDRLRARTDPLGATTRYGYDDAGHVIDVTRPDGTRALAEYNARGRRVAMIGPDGAVWRTEYDDAGKPRREIDPLGATTEYAYDQTGSIAAIIDALGNVTRYESNALGLPLAVTDPLGGVTRYEYDAAGRLVAMTDPLGRTTRMAWTAEGLLRERSNPDGTVWRWEYDGEDNLVASVDADGGRTVIAYDHFDLPVSETAPDGGRLSYEYDTESRLVAVTNEHGHVWRHEYDPAGNLVRETDFTGRVLSYEYDAAGRLIRQVTGAGEVIVIERDAMGRVIRRGDAVFGYDPAGRLVLARNADAEVTIAYDAAGRVIGESINGRTVRSERDAVGRRVRLVTPGGRASVWEYDAVDHPVLLGSGARTFRFGWDPAGRQVSREWGAATVGQSWNADDRLAGQRITAGDRVLHERGYGYRADGFLTSIEDSVTGTRQLTVDAAGRLAAPVGDVRYEHDADGRVVQRQHNANTWRYRWNPDSRLVSVSTPDGHVWRYRYDGFGRRVAKQRFDGQGRLLEQVDFTWDGAELVEQVHGGPALRPMLTAWDWEPGGDRAVSQAERALDQADERVFAIVTDQIGAPAQLVADDGTVTWHAHDTPWGAPLGERAPAPTPLRFPGQYHDPETGLHYNLHRYYDPETGRYLTHDPLGLEAGPDTLVYAGNPTEWIDPLGLAACRTKGAAAASGAGGGGRKPPNRNNKPYSKPTTGNNSRRKYRIGSHGAKKTEQQRLSSTYNTKVSGDTHESEHPIGYEVLGGRTGVPRGTAGQARDIENHAPAYQEAEPAHTGHIGTGNRSQPAAVGTSAFGSADQYRQHQWNSLTDTAEGGRNNVSNAVQLNQVDYAHQQSFHNTTGTPSGQIADDSYHHMVDHQEGHGVGYATGPGQNAHTPPVSHSSAAEMHLARGAARTGQWPTEQQISDHFNPPPTQAQRDAQAAADGFPPGTYDPPPPPDAMDVDP